MADLENNINPTLDSNVANQDMVQINDLNANLWEQNQLNQSVFEQPEIQESQQIIATENDQITPNMQTNSDLNSIPVETTNNENVLWQSEEATISTAQEQEIPAQLNNPLTEQTSQEEEMNSEDSQKSKLAQKEKLLQLIKTHESKAKTKWFATWILSGVVLCAWILTLSCIFAKDQIVNLLNWDNGNPALSASVVDLSDNIIENEIHENEDDITYEDETAYENEDGLNNYEDMDYEDVNNYENYETDIPEYNEDLNEYSEDNEEISNYEAINEENEYSEDTEKNLDENSDNIIPENNEDNSYEDNLSSEEITVPEYDNISEEEDTNIEYEVSEDESPKINNWYNITHVNSIEEANWVLPSHCSDLTCYGEDKEFTPCTTFKLNEKLEENSNRIGNNWVCRYKDASELVLVEIK